jgi:hypothetical protein
LAIEPPLHGTDSLTIAVHNAPPGAFGFLALSRRQDSRSFAGIELLVDTTTPHAMLPAQMDPVAGCASHNLTLPNDLQSIGTEFFAQWILRDQGAPGGLSATQGMRFKVL